MGKKIGVFDQNYWLNEAAIKSPAGWGARPVVAVSSPVINRSCPRGSLTQKTPRHILRFSRYQSPAPHRQQSDGYQIQIGGRSGGDVSPVSQMHLVMRLNVGANSP